MFNKLRMKPDLRATMFLVKDTPWQQDSRCGLGTGHTLAAGYFMWSGTGTPWQQDSQYGLGTGHTLAAG
jgi:hypothetical protein